MVRKGVPPPAELKAQKQAVVDTAVQKKARATTAASRLRKFNRAVKTAQRNSSGERQFNRTQFKRLVVHVMRESAADIRISAAALDPLMELVQSQLHKTFVLTRIMSFNVQGKRSIDLRSFNLAEAALLRPHLFEAGPSLVTTSFDDDILGIQSELTAFTGVAPPKKAKAPKGEATEAAGGDAAAESEEFEDAEEEAADAEQPSD